MRGTALISRRYRLLRIEYRDAVTERRTYGTRREVKLPAGKKKILCSYGTFLTQQQ
jgi:hypothetical protein